jgi:SAM-dependent methyltransferase
MSSHDTAFAANRALWNSLAGIHVASEFYDVEGFVAGRNSLSALERELLGDVNGLKLLHLQCHFGQDTLSLARMGAQVTGLDMSDRSVEEAGRLAERCGLDAEWVVGNVMELQPGLEGRFDVVFTSYGTIGWLPEVGAWAANINRYLKPGGKFIFVDFHPVVWMFDNSFSTIAYSYFNREPIVEIQQGSYADANAPVSMPAYGWNHALEEVLGALLKEGLVLETFRELDGSPHNCFPNMVQGEDGLFRIAGMEGKLPLVQALRAHKPK